VFKITTVNSVMSVACWQTMADLGGHTKHSRSYWKNNWKLLFDSAPNQKFWYLSRQHGSQVQLQVTV